MPLICQGAAAAGVIEAAGDPFCFNGIVPRLSFDPQLFAPSGGATYGGASRIDSGLPFSLTPPTRSRSISPSRASTGTSAISTPA